MPPPLALLLFATFVVWLFLRYRKNSGSVPFRLWVPLFWIGINASRPVMYWLADGQSAATAVEVTEGNYVDRNIYLVLLCLGVVILFRRKYELAVVLKSGRLLLLLYVFYLISTLWSDYPYISLKRWIKDAGDVVMVLVLVTDDEPLEALRAVFVRCFYVLVPLSVLFIKYYPELGRYTHRWTYKTYYSGVSGNKNSLGILAMLGGLFMLWEIVDLHHARKGRIAFRSVWPESIIFLMCIWLLWIAQSATAIACFLCGAFVLLVARGAWVRSHHRYFGWWGAGIGVLVILFTVSVEFRGVVAGVLGRDVTLTDRTLIWDYAMRAGTDPVLGSGFSSFWLTEKSAEIQEVFHVTVAHNGFIECYLHTGIVGVVLLAVVLVGAFGNVIACYKCGPVPGRLFLALFLVGMLFNYTEVAFYRANALGLLIWLMALYVPKRENL